MDSILVQDDADVTPSSPDFTILDGIDWLVCCLRARLDKSVPLVSYSVLRGEDSRCLVGQSVHKALEVSTT